MAGIDKTWVTGEQYKLVRRWAYEYGEFTIPYINFKDKVSNYINEYDEIPERKVLKTLRLDKIIISAVKQSRKPYRPQLTPLTRFNDFIKKERAGLKFIAHCYEEIPSVDFFDTASKEKEQASSDGITVLIGPEGDFSIDEVREAMKYGFTPISLGKSRLRTETAALYAAMCAQLICRKD